MFFRRWVVPFAAAGILAFAIPACSQVAPSYQEDSLGLKVGIGASSYDVDWGHGRMYGGTIWADWYPQWMPAALRGLGMEVEARDISLNRNLPSQANLRQDTAGGGPIFAWSYFRNFHPYVKYLISYGSYDFSPVVTQSGASLAHESLSLRAPGLGFEIRIYRPLWMRADYEYQTWQNLLGNTPNPQGFTLGASYNFAYPYASKR